MYRAFYEDSERYGWVEQEEMKWQAQWFWEHSRNADKYERGGWYASEAEAIRAAKRGRDATLLMHKLMSQQGE